MTIYYMLAETGDGEDMSVFTVAPNIDVAVTDFIGHYHDYPCPDEVRAFALPETDQPLGAISWHLIQQNDVTTAVTQRWPDND